MARAVSQPSRPPAFSAQERPVEGRPPEPLERGRLDQGPRKDNGRGARSNISGRFEKFAREQADDGWDNAETPAPLKTDITIETPRTIINYVASPFVGFDRSINPYRGCEHGCTYCFARPTHAYYGLSAGLDFESKLFVKPNAAQLLERELSAKKYKLRHIAIGTNTDPYQPIEKKFRVMRGILGVLERFNHPVSVLTKSALICRDIDLLAPMAKRNIVKTMLSITTLNPRLARAMEPRASSPKRRLDAVRRLVEAGVPVGVMTAPMIPGLNDHELEDLLEAAKDAGASAAGYTIIRLPMEVSGLFAEWLEAKFPDRKARVMNHIREMNGGKNYDPHWSRVKKPRSAYSKLIAERFAKTARKLGFEKPDRPLDLTKFSPPKAISPQLHLFE